MAPLLRIFVMLAVLLAARGAAAEINGGPRYYCACWKEVTTGWWIFQKTTIQRFDVEVTSPHANCGLACGSQGGSAAGIAMPIAQVCGDDILFTEGVEPFVVEDVVIEDPEGDPWCGDVTPGEEPADDCVLSSPSPDPTSPDEPAGGVCETYLASDLLAAGAVDDEGQFLTQEPASSPSP